MPTTLIDSLKSLITPTVVSKAASQFGESEAAVAQALPAGAATVLAGLLGKANDSGSMGRIFELITDRSNDGTALSNIAGLLGGGGGSPLVGLGSRLLSLLFGDRTSALSGALAGATGIKSSTASSILGFAAPLVMALLGSRARSEGLTASGLSSLLLGQKDSILSALPSGLASLLGAPAPAVAAVREPVRRSNAWIWPLVLLAIAGLWMLLRKRPEPPASAPVAAAVPAVTPPGDVVSLTVCDTAVSVNRGGIETGLIAFVEDKGRMVDETTWFDFDRLLFETGSANLRPESSDQLKNVAMILKCFPSVKVKVGGYTDNTGDPAANQKLSQARAESVSRELVAMGVDPGRLSAEGYGEQHPVADNSTEEGRAKNRRISLRVTSK
jgi:OOP family OmpA-OmpF porin